MEISCSHCNHKLICKWCDKFRSTASDISIINKENNDNPIKANIVCSSFSLTTITEQFSPQVRQGCC